MSLFVYLCVLLLVFSVILYAPGSKRVTQFQFSVCMYGTCGRIDNKADFDFDFDNSPLVMVLIILFYFLNSTKHHPVIEPFIFVLLHWEEE